jgi:hypothetical protein
VRAVGALVEIERGRDWAFGAWRSREGVCVAYASGSVDNWAFGCGREERRPGDEGPDGLITLLVTPSQPHGAADRRGAIMGAVTPDVARVELELVDGRVLSAPARDAPDELETTAGFFLVRVPLEGRGRLLPVAVSFYAAADRLLERFEPRATAGAAAGSRRR